MREYLQGFFHDFSYPPEAAETFLAAYDAIHADPDVGKRFDSLIACYEQDKNCDVKPMIDEAGALSQVVSVHEYTGKLLLFLCMSKALKAYYQEEGLSIDIWFTSMCDLKYKAVECKLVHGVWGSFVCEWFIRFFRMTCFGFEKLQCELIPFKKNYEKNGVCLTPESVVINVHIPRTGGKLDAESLKKSFALAAAFFKEHDQLSQIVFVCASWLLFPKHLEVLSPDSNLRRFISCFDIVNHGEYEDYEEVWRLFDKEYTGDAELLPQNTSLRRIYADWIRKGEKTGWGHGVYVYSEQG